MFGTTYLFFVDFVWHLFGFSLNSNNKQCKTKFLLEQQINLKLDSQVHLCLLANLIWSAKHEITATFVYFY